jgi:hypothetical protein
MLGCGRRREREVLELGRLHRRGAGRERRAVATDVWRDRARRRGTRQERRGMAAAWGETELGGTAGQERHVAAAGMGPNRAQRSGLNGRPHPRRAPHVRGREA